jgi:hypothetical protein
VSVFAAFTGALLILVACGDLFDHNPGWFLGPIEKVLKAKDRENLLAIKSEIAQFGWRFDAVLLLWAGAWFALGHFLWRVRLLPAARSLFVVALFMVWVSRGWIEPEIGKTKSYREFMAEVNRTVKPDDKLVLLGAFNSDPVNFYRGRTIELDGRPAAKLSAGDNFIITSVEIWQAAAKTDPQLAPPLLRSAGKGPEGDAPLVLLRAEIS